MNGSTPSSKCLALPDLGADTYASPGERPGCGMSEKILTRREGVIGPRVIDSLKATPGR